MLMPTTVASPLPTVMAPGQANTMVTPTSASVVPTVTTTIQPMQQKDTTWTKLFVGGLPYHTTDKSLRDHFEVYGDIEEAVVITDRSTGKSRGYGFVIMSTKEAAERACKEPNPIIDGRKANVNLAILGAKPRGNLTAQLPLTALRPGFPALLGGQYGQPVQQQPNQQYLQQLYAAAASPYGQLSPNIMQLMQGMSTGNPLLDMYQQQYAAAGYPCAVTQPQMCPVTQSLSLDASQANAAMAGGYLGYAYAPLTAQQLSAAGLSAAGLPAAYAAAAGPTTAAGQAQQQPQDTRIQ
eukprot:TRINITY_DN4904_c0_g1_i1.p1 TRINITY_DN4904_c0_g1~~TRINITY_DN4904_c0_g1_i1.p1  ORF type:complete len:295 (+),score=69.23 TRINITY_DN4904_c0_g1_i1:350-1234(+)